MTPRSRGGFRPIFTNNVPPFPKRGRGECRAPGAPAASCAHGVVSMHTSIHSEVAGITRHSPRNGFNGLYRALPGDRAFLPPSPLRSLLLKNLMPASGHQDHTTSPSAEASFVRA